MKKLFFTLAGSIMFMYIIWIVIFAISVDDWSQLPNYHIDLYSMVYRFAHNDSLSYGFMDTFRSMVSSLTKLNELNWVDALLTTSGATYDMSSGWAIATAGINLLVNPLYTIANTFVIIGYLIALVVQFLLIISNIVTAMVDFVISPIWIINS